MCFNFECSLVNFLSPLHRLKQNRKTELIRFWPNEGATFLNKMDLYINFFPAVLRFRIFGLRNRSQNLINSVLLFCFNLCDGDKKLTRGHSKLQNMSKKQFIFWQENFWNWNKWEKKQFIFYEVVNILKLAYGY